MSQDGADLNVGAEAGLKAVLGCKDEPKRMSDVAFERMIREATRCDTYGSCANRFARLVLEYLEAHPEFDGDANATYDAVCIGATKADLAECLEELTGFMVGWGVNAARHILKRAPKANPAILEIG